MIVVMVINIHRSSSGSILLHNIALMWYCLDVVCSGIRTPQAISFGFSELFDSLIFEFFLYL